MDTSPLVRDEIEAGAVFLQKLNEVRPVVAACWLREAENEERYLYAALDGLTDDDFDIAYSEVSRIVKTMKDDYIDPFRVKLIGKDHSVAKAVIEIYQRYSGRIPTELTVACLLAWPLRRCSSTHRSVAILNPT